jgi:hypothetical protein
MVPGERLVVELGLVIVITKTQLDATEICATLIRLPCVLIYPSFPGLQHALGNHFGDSPVSLVGLAVSSTRPTGARERHQQQKVFVRVW